MAGEHVGRSLIEILWEQADVQYANLVEREKAWNKAMIADLLREGKASPKVREKYAEDIIEHLQLQGKLQGLAYALFRMTDPYGEDVKMGIGKIRDEMAERWEAEYGSDEYEEEDEDEDGDL